tara:strand:- start:422 stop:799 length:378 start_codon:yes stop_codon:yes gene_type:complete
MRLFIFFLHFSQTSVSYSFSFLIRKKEPIIYFIRGSGASYTLFIYQRTYTYTRRLDHILSIKSLINLLFTNVKRSKKTPLIRNLSFPSVTAIIKHKKEPTPNKEKLLKINTFSIMLLNLILFNYK